MMDYAGIISRIIDSQAQRSQPIHMHVATVEQLFEGWFFVNNNINTT